MPPKKAARDSSKVNASMTRSENVPVPAGLSTDSITSDVPPTKPKKATPRATPSNSVKPAKITRANRTKRASTPDPSADNSLTMASSSPLSRPLALRLAPSTLARNTRSKAAIEAAGSPILAGVETWTKLSSAKILKGMFPQFAKLPIEIRLMIWHEACVPRIVGMKPANIPGIAHACKNSRDIAKYYFKIRDFKTGIFMDPKMDILHFDRTSFSPEIGYHVSAYHTLRCRKVSSNLLKRVERVAMSVDEVLNVWKIECFHCFLTTKMINYFPNIKELMIILRPGPLDSDYEDLNEVTKSDNPWIQTIIDDVNATFNHAQNPKKTLAANNANSIPNIHEKGPEKNIWKDVQLKFVRLEKWER
ncbi:uncharacterized protein PAC_07184 [Phialocephala subalpina]|uniref:2EXR domain-containing protein n=1 Tax=Phialocephala subalpina TaxID=576137 RepID=A0A1L7WX03_9HELO|nr:uncharacterized protein PAC_07184 [Phialocephala subalpina]